MDKNKAIKIIEDAYPKLKIRYVVKFRSRYVFVFKDADIRTLPVMYVSNDGNIHMFSPRDPDFIDFIDVFGKRLGKEE